MPLGILGGLAADMVGVEVLGWLVGDVGDVGLAFTDP